ncbi:hypothetical protein DPMN_076251 [Dreissena polymorpha]|uniref:Uncharacterized protein n=1 Tax=Dreissena polymorpha TaxID=45954 RepID=A0A9D4BN84_DREPO|nr:hypothetical protein DPMN_076251 [Dreissena polymorpha]
MDTWCLTRRSCINLLKLLVHNYLSLAIDMVAMTIFIWTSAVLVPSFDKTDPKYLKLITFSRFSPFMFFNLTVLTSILYALALSESL